MTEITTTGDQVKNKMITAALLSILLLPNLVFAKKLDIDPYHSSIVFEAIHLKISKIPGRFIEFTGSVDLDEKDFTKSKVDFTVQIASITTEVQKRDDHLRSPDFFDAAKFPKAIFKSTSIKKSGGSYVLNGDLTIRDVTKPISFAVKSQGSAQDPMMKVEKTVFHGAAEINRKDFGVSFGPDALISDKISLSINLEMIPVAVK